MAADGKRNAAGRDLADARIAVIGMGALGCAAAPVLAAAGVGTLILLDSDVVELSNLPRQPLYREDDLGLPKVLAAASALRDAHPGLELIARVERLTAANLADVFTSDFVIDATDDVATKFLINDGAVAFGRPYSHAGILGFLGQTLTVVPGTSACYRCLFPEAPPADGLPTCQTAGVIGAIAGVIGAVQAGEAIKQLTGRGRPLTDRLLTVDLLSGRWRQVRLARNPRCPACAGRPAAGRLDAAGPAR